jgi:hypothetical protein
MTDKEITASEIIARRNSPDVLKREKEFIESMVEKQKEAKELVIGVLLNRTLEIIKELDLPTPPEENEQ